MDSDTQGLVMSLGDFLRGRGCRMATAESCTGGLAASTLTDVAGSSDWFEGGVVAYDISALMEYRGLSLEAACHKVILEKQVALGGEGGVIAVDGLGNIALIFNSEGMYRGWEKEGEQAGWGIWEA